MLKLKTVVQKTLASFLINKNVYKASKMPFYAVAKGRTPGIFMNWADCEAQVKGFSGARYKKFDTADAAQKFITDVVSHNILPASNSFNKPKNQPSSSNKNLKRNYSNSSNYGNSNSFQPTSSSLKNQKRKDQNSDEDAGFSDGSDDLNTILTKQLDDVEKRLKGFEKNVDKIIKKNTKSYKGGERKAIMIEPPQPKRRKTSGGSDFETDNDGYVQVYTDGACSANGRSGARAGLGIYWGEAHPLNTSEPVSGRATNNCGEIQAATKAIKLAMQNGVTKLSINTDSKFLINSVTKWMPGWKRKGWKLQSGEPVKNETDFKDLDSVQNKLDIKWNYVEAHRGIHGNEMADQLAKAGAAMNQSK
ncbi:ribonuclease H1-like [Ostrinia furnacalis]|uniref:ribonuclease H1-like n=1 Tax=Ostrinia furnacalis TaxID=93504 RepID=UPI00103EF321|nr:ribonuclease H1-like [Ostrinia furnacalis]